MMLRKKRLQNVRWLHAAIEPCERRMLLSAGSVGAGVQLTVDPTGVSSKLLALAEGGSASADAADSDLVYDSSGRVDVRITASDVDALTAPLAAVGFNQVATNPADHFVEGFIPLSSLETINSLSSDGLLGVLPSYRPQLSAGAIDSEGDSILEADRARAATGVTGSGVTVGVLSDSYNDLGTAAADVTSGDLPSNVNVLSDFSSGGTDEGRAMLQIVHDLAPGASLAFATADNSEQSFANNILALAKPVASKGAGANVIVDDITYYDEPYFQDGTVAQAINTVVTNSNVSDFVAAGNDDTQAYDSASVNFSSGTIAGISSSAQQYYNFNYPGNPNGTAVNEQSLTLAANQPIQIGLQWDQPYYSRSGVTTTLTLYLVNQNTGTVVASGTTNTIANQTPFQFLSYTQSSSGSANYYLVIEKAAGTVPGRIKYENFGDGYDVAFNTFATNSPTINPHSAAVNAISVAAAAAGDQRDPEPYTSAGPSTILFNSSGGRYSAPQVRAKPDLTAIDGASTTFFGEADYGNGFYQFFGTSAAAPHAAAVAALIKSANPSYTPAQIYAALKASADPNIGTGNVNLTGSGLIDAYRAMVGNAVPAVATVSDGFESGYLAQDWTTYNAGGGKTEPATGNSPASGSYQLIEDGVSDGDGFPVLAEATLNLNVPSYASNVVLNFSQKKFYNSGDAAFLLDYPLPATFTGHGNYDGVSLSVDGTHWYSILSLTGSNSTTTYQAHTFNLSQIAAADGLTLGATTQIKFQYYDADSFTPPDGGFAFDNIAISTALAFTGPQYYFKLDSDLTHLDVYAANVSTGALYIAAPLAAEINGVTVTGSSTPQSVTVDFSNGNPLAGILTYNASGASSANQLLAIGTTAGNDTITAATGVLTVNGISLIGNNVGTLSFAPGTGTDALSVNSGTLTLAQRAGGGLVTDLFSTLNVAGKLAVASPTSHATRTLVDTATLTIAGVTGNWTGTLDLNANDLAVTSGSLATITNQAASGFNNGTWAGTGIASSAAAANTSHTTAMGTILNTANGTQPLYGSGTGLTTFDGASPGTAAVLVKYTYYGDATLDGKTDASDYSRIDAAFLANTSTPSTSTGWFNGDFNYDTVINGTDYTLIDNAFNRQSTSLAAEIASPTAIIAKASVAKALLAVTALPFASQPVLLPAIFSDNSLIKHHHRAVVDAGLTLQ